MTTTRQRRSFGQIRRKASGRWHASFLPPGGTIRRVNAPHTFQTKREAERWLAAVEVDLRRGDYRDPDQGRVTLSAFGQQFLRDHCSRVVPSARNGYRRIWTNRIDPALGHRLLRDVKPSHVRSWLAELTSTRLSASQVRQSFRLLSMILDAAVGDEHLSANPCAPLRRSLPRMPEAHPTILAPDEVEALRAAMPEGRDRLMFDLMAWSGRADR